MKPNHILISGTYDNLADEPGEGTEFELCDRSYATHVSVFLVDDHGNVEPIEDYPLGSDPAKAYVDALMLAAVKSSEHDNLRILDTYQKRKGQLKDLGAPNIHVYKVGEDGEVRKQVEEQSPQPRLTVWYGAMPESNGKTNYTAILRRVTTEGLLGDLSNGITIARSEYPERVRYEADRMRFLIGEIAVEPFILDYDADKHSGYKHPDRFEQMAESKGYDVTKNVHGGYVNLSTRHLRAGWDAARSTW